MCSDAGAGQHWRISAAMETRENLTDSAGTDNDKKFGPLL